MKKGLVVAEKLRGMKLSRAAEILREGIEETLRYYRFPREHWLRIRTNNPLERIRNHERDQAEDISCRVLSRWQFCIDAGSSTASTYSRDQVGIKAVSQDGSPY